MYMNASLVPRPSPAFRCLKFGKAGEGLVSFLTSDVRIERMVESVLLCMGALGPEQQKEPRYQVTYYMYLAGDCRTYQALSVWSVE